MFYRAAGFELRYGGGDESFASFSVGSQYLNLSVEGSGLVTGWGRVIFYVESVDAMFEHLVAQGLKPAFSPRDAPWGERYFHIVDPDGHEISFARPLSDGR